MISRLAPAARVATSGSASPLHTLRSRVRRLGHWPRADTSVSPRQWERSRVCIHWPTPDIVVRVHQLS